jgi:predicted nuclease of predicted toxin-antitoxin system
LIIFDENVDQWIINCLKEKMYDVFSIRENSSGISDLEVIKIVESKKGILVTEDKDFGELVFSYNLKNCSVILLRYDKSDKEQIAKSIELVLKYLSKVPDFYFFTISKHKIRKRKI